MARAGRKRKAAKHIPVQRERVVRVPDDHGTDELRVRKLALVKGGDPAKSTLPIDLLATWHGVKGCPCSITNEQWLSGLKFRALDGAVYPKRKLTAAPLDGLQGREIRIVDEDFEDKAESRMKTLIQALMREDFATYRAVHGLCVSDRLPLRAEQWLAGRFPTAEAILHWGRLVTGLDIVAAEMGLSRRVV
ncbi:MAG: hypothetical protein QNJ62_05070 [Methyloceanibacter sp.]|nr:hypothetical protein [Methyloceanibacter sp.]